MNFFTHSKPCKHDCNPSPSGRARQEESRISSVQVRRLVEALLAISSPCVRENPGLEHRKKTEGRRGTNPSR